MTFRQLGLASITLALVAFMPVASLAQEPVTRQVPASREAIQQSFAPLVKATAPAVVNVYAARQVQARSPFAGDPFFEQFFGGQLRGSRPRVERSLGSGVIVDKSGVVVTNNHVIKDADEIKVALSDGREFSSKILLRDETSDLAVLKIESGDTFPVIALADSDKVEVGDLVLAIGNPFGVGQTVTSGIVSAQSRTQVGISDFDFFIQTDAAINPGNSGGGLIDMQGKLIGINTAIYSRSGGSVGIGFAIPSNMVRAVVASALKGNKSFERPYIGATFQSIDSDIAASLGLKSAFGALVTAVVKGGPADVAGLKVGDVVLKVQDVRADNPDVLGYRLSTAGIGATVNMDIMRNGKSQTIAVKLAREPEVKQAAPVLIDGDSPFAGASVVDLNARNASRLRLPRGTTGVAIADIYPGSPAQRIGLRPGDIIRRINKVEIRSVQALTDILDAGRPGLMWQLEIERNGALIRQFVR
ncbi:DegQ family serine endoprotease [Daeguia caeni]|uniref:DegQ family serine endoprotease n=1 Tax=Daeguia caeni TaxID=439612 RepID=A0ABV9H789_9HYPH